jgi:hypothetical protein
MKHKTLQFFILAVLLSILISCGKKDKVYQLEPEQNSNIIILGNSFAVALQDHNYFETLLYKSFPEQNLRVRNLAWSADEINLQPRPVNFGTLDEHLQQQKADIIFACYGLNEAFKGPDSLETFKHQMVSYLSHLKKQKYNGHSEPKVILVSPIAHERLGGFLPDPTEHNYSLKLYSQAMREVANDMDIPFIDLYEPTSNLMKNNSVPLTKNGIHLNENGYLKVGEIMAKALGLPVSDWKSEPQSDNLRKIIALKNQHFFMILKPKTVNTFMAGVEIGLGVNLYSQN